MEIKRLYYLENNNDGLILMEMFKKYMLGRYQEKSRLTKMFNTLYILVLGLIFLGNNSIEVRIAVSLLLVLFISREIIDSW